MAYRFGSGMGFDREIRLARLKKLQFATAVLGITALVFVLLEGESSVTTSRLVWFGVGIACLLINKYAVWRAQNLQS